MLKDLDGVYRLSPPLSAHGTALALGTADVVSIPTY